MTEVGRPLSEAQKKEAARLTHRTTFEPAWYAAWDAAAKKE